MFGEHTFFLDRNGLNIVEPAEAAGAATRSATVVNLASWSDDNRSGLELHEPEATDVVITFESRHLSGNRARGGLMASSGDG